MTGAPLRFLLSVLAGSSIACYAGGNEKVAEHDPSVHIGAGLKKELIAGITEADFCKLGDKSRTLRITLVAALTETNSGMNFNGYARGDAAYTIPAGWTVEVIFINPSPVPHSAIVVDREMLRNVRMGEPAFEGASTPNPLSGMSTSKAMFTFIASDPGKYAFACGIPTHATSGHWIRMDVSADAKVPTLKLGDSPPKEAK